VPSVQIKGTALGSVQRYVHEQFGEAEWRALLAGLPPEERQPIEGGILVSAWYPFALFVRMVQAAEAQLGLRVPRLHHDMGRAAAEYGLTTFYKLFYKVGSPQFIITRSAKVWRTYYTSGDMTVPVCEDGHAVVQLAGFEEPARELCARLPGFFERTVELSGGRSVRLVHETCVHRGGEACRFESWWS
jgi:predicted hydrocarbon binding protein